MVAKPLVTIENLNHFYGEGELCQQTLFNVNLVIYPQEFIIITGPSGSGKSTLLSLIGCLRSVQDGSLNILGQELKGATQQQLVQMRRNFGYITQASNLLDFLTAQQNVQMSLELSPQLSPQQTQQKAKDILETVGLGDRLHYYPDNLSGGERQRVAIACALVTQPKLVLADEPTAALDKVSGRNAITLMHQLAKEQGSAVIMVTHDNRILDLADRIIQVEDGKLELALHQELAIALPGVEDAFLSDNWPQPAVVTYRPGEIILKEGEPATQFYIILAGEVEAIKELPNQPPKLLNRLNRGQYFGEIGLLEGGKRTATVRVATHTEAKVMVLEKEDFQRLMKGSGLTSNEIARRMQERLMKSHLTTLLPTLTLENLNDASLQAKTICYGPNSNIIQPGDIPKKFYILSKGRVAILKRDRENREIQEKILIPGDTFGMIEVIADRPYNYTVRVMADAEAEVLVLDRTVFSDLVVTAYSQPLATAEPDVDRIAASLRRRLLKNINKPR